MKGWHLFQRFLISVVLVVGLPLVILWLSWSWSEDIKRRLDEQS